MKSSGRVAKPVTAKKVPCPGTAYASARNAAVTASVKSATASIRTRKPAGPAASRTPIANATASTRITWPARSTVWYRKRLTMIELREIGIAISFSR